MSGDGARAREAPGKGDTARLQRIREVGLSFTAQL